VLHALPISVLFIWSTELFLVRGKQHEAPCYVIFSTPLLPHSSQAQIFSSAAYSRKRWDYILPSIHDILSVTNFTLLAAGTILWCTKNLQSEDTPCRCDKNPLITVLRSRQESIRGTTYNILHKVYLRHLQN
jgi:hypothetical protein